MTSFFQGVLRLRLLVLALAAGLLVAGVVQLRGAPVDVLPEFTPPYAEIQTEALGLSAEEVEQLITVPLEADLLNGVQGVEVIRSESVPGLSSIVLVFAPGSDVYQARQLVEERLTQAHALPNVSKPPTLLQPLSSSNRVLMIGLSSSDLSLIEQSVIARWTLRPQLMGVAGVANVSVWGMRDQQLQVQVDPTQLRNKKVSLNQVVSTTGNAQVVSPLTFLEASTPGTGGFVETPQQRLQVRHLLEKIADPIELAKVPVQGTGGRLQLGDVAQLKVDHQPLIGNAVVGGGPGLFLVVEKFPRTSTTDVTAGVEEALETLRPGLTGITSDTTVFRPADYVDSARSNLGLGLAVGAGLMLLALLAFRSAWRTVVVAAVTVPLSLITAAALLTWLGQGINALIIAGLAAAITIVVDEAVSAAEAVLGRLRGTGTAAAASAGGGTVVAGVRDGSASVRPLLLVGTLAAALAILPAAAMQGRPGAFLAPLVWSYLLASTAAVIIAMTVAPALTAVLYARSTAGSTRDWPWTGRLVDRYGAAVGAFSRSLQPALAVSAAFGLIVLIMLPFVQTALVPRFEDRNVVVQLEGQPGVSNALMTDQTTQAARAIEAVPGVVGVGAHVGRAETGDRVVNVSSSDVWVTLAVDADYDATVGAIGDAARGVSGLSANVMPYTTHTMQDVGALRGGGDHVSGNSMDVLTGVDQPLAVRIYGQDPAVLAEQATRVQRLMGQVSGVVEPRVLTAPTQPTIEIEVDLQKAHALGMTPGAVRRAEATLLQGIQVGSVFEDQKVFDVVVQGAPSTRRSLDDVRNLLIDREDGAPIRLSQVAEVRMAQTPAVIDREAVSRRIDVVAGLDGRRAAAVAADLKGRLAAVDMPLEYHAEVLTQSTAAEIGQGRMIGVAVAAVLGAFLVIQAALRSWRLALVTTLAIPLALTGGLVATAFLGAEISLGALLGFLAVLGLAIRVGLAMVGELGDAERADGGTREQPHLVQQAAGSRLIPVLTSSLAVAALALPFVVLGPRAGLEILHPLAVVLLGGVVTTAFVTLFVLPACYLHAGQRPGTQDLPDEAVFGPAASEAVR